MHIRLCVSVTPFMSGEDTMKVIKATYPGIKISMALNKRIFKFMTYIIKQVPTSGELVHIYFNARTVSPTADAPGYVVADDFNLTFATLSGTAFSLNGEVYKTKPGYYNGLVDAFDQMVFNIFSGNPPEWAATFGQIRNMSKMGKVANVYFMNGVTVHIPMSFFGE